MNNIARVHYRAAPSGPIIFLLSLFSTLVLLPIPTGGDLVASAVQCGATGGEPGVDGVLTPVQIHTTWEDDPSTGVTVTWKSDVDYLFHVVKYGTEPGSYPNWVSGDSHWSPNQLIGIIHDVELTDLDPDTKYYFKCGDGLLTWSDECSFHTAPEGFSGSFSFTVGGDDGISPNAAAVAEILAEEDARFHLHTGDLSCADGVQILWDTWFLNSELYMRSRQIYPSIGNHEVEDIDAVRDAPLNLFERGFTDDFGFGRSTYLGRFALPGNEQWHSVDYGPIHLVSLDSDEDYYEGSEQYQWLEEDLAEASQDPATSWIICLFHKPPYSASPVHGSSMGIRASFCPLFDRYGVDLAFNGHDHNYERSFPMYAEEVTTDEMYYYENPGGTIYIVTGGGGRWLYESGTDYWTLMSVSKHHYINCNLVAEDELLVEVVSAHYCPVEALLTGASGRGELLDEFRIVKSGGRGHSERMDLEREIIARRAHAGLEPLSRPGIAEKLEVLREFRDSVLYGRSSAKWLAMSYYGHSPEINKILEGDTRLAERVKSLIVKIIPVLSSSLPGIIAPSEPQNGDAAEVRSSSIIREGIAIIDIFLSKDISPGLRSDIEKLHAIAAGREGLTPEEILDNL